jgi:hypothetical protein
MWVSKWAAMTGVVFYTLWGIFHLVAAYSVYNLAEQVTGMMRGRLLQDAFYLLFFAISGMLIVAILNWRNDKQGYRMNGTLIAVADIPFVLFVLVPGLIPWWPGLVGQAAGSSGISGASARWRTDGLFECSVRARVFRLAPSLGHETGYLFCLSFRRSS